MFGILTIALGEKRYIEMAKMLALSLIQSNPQIKRAVVTDVDSTEFAGLYDIHIQHNPALGKGLLNKLYLDEYSPFEETLFIDADCLVFWSLDNMLELCRKHSFVVFGDQISQGEWYMNVAEMCKKFKVPSIPLFNGGTYYFKKETITTNIYNTARQLYENYNINGFHEFRGSINEEPLIAIAMAINKVEAVDDKGIGMRTPIGIVGPLKIDILNGVCVFNKQGEIVKPAIMHFVGSTSVTFHYKREITKLRIITRLPSLNRKLVSLIVNVIFNTPYFIYVFGKRVVKVIIRGERFNFNIVLPVFSNN